MSDLTLEQRARERVSIRALATPDIHRTKMAVPILSFDSIWSVEILPIETLLGTTKNALKSTTDGISALLDHFQQLIDRRSARKTQLRFAHFDKREIFFPIRVRLCSEPRACQPRSKLLLLCSLSLSRGRMTRRAHTSAEIPCRYEKRQLRFSLKHTREGKTLKKCF